MAVDRLWHLPTAGNPANLRDTSQPSQPKDEFSVSGNSMISPGEHESAAHNAGVSPVIGRFGGRIARGIGG
jgi:hypothetical protein